MNIRPIAHTLTRSEKVHLLAALSLIDNSDFHAGMIPFISIETALRSVEATWFLYAFAPCYREPAYSLRQKLLVYAGFKPEEHPGKLTEKDYARLQKREREAELDHCSR